MWRRCGRCGINKKLKLKSFLMKIFLGGQETIYWGVEKWKKNIFLNSIFLFHKICAPHKIFSTTFRYAFRDKREKKEKRKSSEQINYFNCAFYNLLVVFFEFCGFNSWWHRWSSQKCRRRRWSRCCFPVWGKSGFKRINNLNKNMKNLI
jgi:hypothetical protein